MPVTCQVKLSGTWWACWQTFREGTHKIASQQVEIKQEGDLLQIATTTRGLPVEEGGYHWSGELRLWDNEVLMGWYAASDGPIRSKGTLYFVLHPHGLHMSGRWTGLGYDGRIMTGWAAMGQTQEEAEQAMARLISSEGATDTDGLPVRGRDHRARSGVALHLRQGPGRRRPGRQRPQLHPHPVGEAASFSFVRLGPA